MQEEREVAAPNAITEATFISEHNRLAQNPQALSDLAALGLYSARPGTNFMRLVLTLLDNQGISNDVAFQGFVESYDILSTALVKQRIMQAFKNFQTATFIDRNPDDADMFLGKRDNVGVNLRDPAFQRKYLGENPSPFIAAQLLGQSDVSKVNSMQARQMEAIIDQFEEALGSDEKANYFKMKETALKMKWKAIINYLKQKASDTIAEKERKDFLLATKWVIPKAFTAGTIEKTDTVILDRSMIIPTEGTNIPYAIYMESDRNIDCTAGIQLWQSFHVTAASKESATLLAKKFLGFKNVLLYSGDNWDVENATTWTKPEENRQLKASLTSDSFVVYMRLQTMRANSNSWKFHLKARNGIFDRILTTFGAKVSFAGFSPSDTVADITNKIDASFKEATDLYQITSSQLTITSFDATLLSEFASRVTFKTYSVANNGYNILTNAYYNLNRTFYAQRKSLSENAAKRMDRYLNKDRKDVNRIKNFLGVMAQKSR